MRCDALRLGGESHGCVNFGTAWGCGWFPAVEPRLEIPVVCSHRNLALSATTKERSADVADEHRCFGSAAFEESAAICAHLRITQWGAGSIQLVSLAFLVMGRFFPPKGGTPYGNKTQPPLLARGACSGGCFSWELGAQFLAAQIFYRPSPAARVLRAAAVSSL